MAACLRRPTRAPSCATSSRKFKRSPKAKGIRIPGENLLETVYRLADAMPEATSSTAQDIARGRRTEIDHLNGTIARLGERLGIPTPVNRTLYALVKLIEESSVATEFRG